MNLMAWSNSNVFFIVVLIVLEVNSLSTFNNVDVLAETVRIKCDDKHTLDNINDFTRLDENKSVKEVIIESCKIPNSSYAVILSAINVKVADIKKLILVNPWMTEGHNSSTGPDPKRLQPLHFSGFELEDLELLNKEDVSVLAIDLEFLRDLTSLKKITLNNLDVWGPFPNSTNIEILDSSDVIFRGNIGGCSNIKIIHINNIKLVDGNERWIMPCQKVEELKLENLSLDTSKKILDKISFRIQNITARNCSLDRFLDTIYLINRMDIKYKNRGIKHIDVSHNNIQYGINSELRNFKGLETLDISYNNLTYFDSYLMYSDDSYKLRELRLDGNNFEDKCVNKFGFRDNIVQTREDDRKYRKELQSALRRVSLSATKLPRLCFGMTLLPQLEFLNVSDNQLTEINYRTFFWTSSEHLEVDARRNPIQKVLFDKNDYESMKRNDPAVTRWSKIKVLTDARLPCDCTHAWFARALRERLLFVEGVQCADGSSIQDPNVFRSC